MLGFYYYFVNYFHLIDLKKYFDDLWLSLKKHEKSVKTPGNSGCKDIFVNLFSGEMVKQV